MKPKMIFYFASTHWDREWYKTVDEFRYMLIPVMDKAIHTLQNNEDFELFTLDGQTCILEDYLTIREEKYMELKKLIQDKKLAIGPWYTMPDEFTLSSESIIQNLLTGHRIAKQYGVEPLKSGYVCDTFGHVANFPQILRGFQIDNALISRGTNDSELDCFFNWTSKDGSSLITFKAPEVCGYGSYYFEVLHEFAPNYEEHIDEITQKSIEYVERELTRTTQPYVILMDAMDHSTIHEFMPEILDRLAKHFECPVVQKRLDELSNYIDDGLPVKEGELNSHCKDNIMHNKLIPHTTSSRYDLKKANDTCQNLIEHYAMPCAAINEINNKDYIYSYITLAYKYLLLNHAHDSICGCSIDAVHKEMLTRFSKTYYTAKEYFTQFCLTEFNNATSEDDHCYVKIFNPLPYEYQGLIEFDIDFSPNFSTQNLPYIRYEQRNTFLIYDESGNELTYNIIEASRGKLGKHLSDNKDISDPHRVALIATLKPMTFTNFYIKPFDKPYRITDRFTNSPNSCENEWIKFEINPIGTINILDKETGYQYNNLHSFIDGCEAGDGWFHTRPINDTVISSLGAKINIEKTFDGYAACKFIVRYEFSLPSQRIFEYDFSRRSDSYQPYIIKSEFTISRVSKLVTVLTEIENNVRDHRLQLHLPTNVPSESYFVNQCNLIVRRQVGIDHSHYLWKEADISEYPFENMAFIRNHNNGLLFISKGGLHEVSCIGDKENSMDITMLRCFCKTVGTNGEVDGQLQGRQIFEYALLPISNETDSELVRIKDQYVSGYREFTIPSGTITHNESAFTFESKDMAYITCMPSQNKGIIIRSANYSDQNSSCTITMTRDIKNAYLCDFLENKIESITVNNNELTVYASPYKMINILIEF
ncbi:glycosyl hydrolase-related protein [Lachnoclostridium sp.]|uniref:glycoside hydrolase family 38 N-terminal domain-containing protein n=1 Tax=Lachnoclostridium sp. TaxID=2028282 RepID=UPI00289DF591|nr:glycosyl hydrolase-related protein [Lachnoclostridium sp.]